jgi:hypothetical protein
VSVMKNQATRISSVDTNIGVLSLATSVALTMLIWLLIGRQVYILPTILVAAACLARMCLRGKAPLNEPIKGASGRGYSLMALLSIDFFTLAVFPFHFGPDALPGLGGG